MINIRSARCCENHHLLMCQWLHHCLCAVAGDINVHSDFTMRVSNSSGWPFVAASNSDTVNWQSYFVSARATMSSAREVTVASKSCSVSCLHFGQGPLRCIKALSVEIHVVLKRLLEHLEVLACVFSVWRASASLASVFHFQSARQSVELVFAWRQ